ncbi:hypothetical protein GGS23DRAFT_360205 [Durotheca rogersii]|uniref:uncharacterized protein n=1 Tax=Durotheca rogersii TaxID=419775 RepID=UPI00221F1C9B|nr:uncharacterized protein GGS23DRAFT_360205 [Durotheca rogersii]KAI5865925.1 hypothetical protein GGS23DRAFT_360205 [Durotheca rogersii]
MRQGTPTRRLVSLSLGISRVYCLRMAVTPSVTTLPSMQYYVAPLYITYRIQTELVRERKIHEYPSLRYTSLSTRAPSAFTARRTSLPTPQHNHATVSPVAPSLQRVYVLRPETERSSACPRRQAQCGVLV